MLSLKDFKEVKIENLNKIAGGVDPWYTGSGSYTTTETREDGKHRDTTVSWTSDKTNGLDFHAWTGLTETVGGWY